MSTAQHAQPSCAPHLPQGYHVRIQYKKYTNSQLDPPALNIVPEIPAINVGRSPSLWLCVLNMRTYFLGDSPDAGKLDRMRNEQRIPHRAFVHL